MSVVTLDMLDGSQRLAVDLALRIEDTTDAEGKVLRSQRVVAVSGEAGTGKTTLIRLIGDALKDSGHNVGIAAPTGKAARRVKEATGHQAMTVHKMLEYTSPREIDEKTGKPYGDTYPRRDRQRPLDYDHIIVDEYMMINRELHANLIAAMKPGCRLLVFGDVRQLPPIEKQARLAQEDPAFKMLLDKFNGVVLDQIHRTTEDSGIVRAGRSILAGRMPMRNEVFKLHVVQSTAASSPVTAVLDLCSEYDFNALNNQIITPGNKGWVGTYKLNARVQELYHDADRETLKLIRHKWDEKAPVHVGVGDKVVCNKNWYDLEASDGSFGVFNGEVGIVKEITELEEVIIDFEDRIVSFPPIVQLIIDNNQTVGFPQKDLALAYVLTTHKCQGSEYQRVVYICESSHFGLLNRRNFYTGVTRARASVDVVCNSRGIQLAVVTKEPRVFGE